MNVNKGYTAFIVDDNPAALETLATDLRQQPEFAEVYTFASYAEATLPLLEKQPDVLFLDVEVPGKTGLEFLDSIRSKVTFTFKVVFYTGFSDYMIDAIRQSAFDYLLKPVTYERLARLLDELSSMRPVATDELVIKTSFGYHALRLSDIEYAEARNKHVVFHLRDGRDIEALESFRSVEDRLEQNAVFFKCHRSYQVNLRNIDHFDRTDIVMRSGACIPLSRSCKQGFQDAYFAVRFGGGRH